MLGVANIVYLALLCTAGSGLPVEEKKKTRLVKREQLSGLGRKAGGHSQRGVRLQKKETTKKKVFRRE